MINTFQLNSNSKAPYTIYLDFTGYTVSGTPWNTYFHDGLNYTSPAYGGRNGLFSPIELLQIQSIWNSVTEDFSIFDVNVTTQDPGVITNGIRVVVGGSGFYWKNPTISLGIAYLNSFGSLPEIPAYVFPVDLRYNPQHIANVITHEVGHTLGLIHDGTPTQEYYSGANNWSPIMGNGISQKVNQWSDGQYPGASSQEDDIEILGGKLGFVPDEFGNSIEFAHLVKIPTQFGIINNQTDVDYFRFDILAGYFDINVSPVTRSGDEYITSISPNLDIQATLYGELGNIIQVDNPIGSMSANIITNLASGTYYLGVDGVGKSGSYGDYGSVGQYLVTSKNTPNVRNWTAPVRVVKPVTDILTGLTSTPDIFVLGDQYSSNDYATINQFNPSEDKVQLTSGDYIVKNNGLNTQIFRDANFDGMLGISGPHTDPLLAVITSQNLSMISNGFEITNSLNSPSWVVFV